jgi:UDP-N-acetylmuramoyl-tripeptide--D-alanyl-D-alanine ligase
VDTGEHRKIGALGATCADVIVGVGEETRALLEAAADVETYWCADAAQAAQFVPTTVCADDLILVKGSRSVGLEKVVSALADEQSE